jgi:hypothetical protein
MREHFGEIVGTPPCLPASVWLRPIARQHALTIPSSSIFLRRIIGSMFMRVNSKCAHQVRPPPGREQAAARNRQPRATCATDPGNAVRFVSRVDAEMTSRAFRLKLRLHAGFGMLELFRAA